ncbi:MAG: hypothetical protein KF708_18370 [Pirellulales bacterium]|nr:hypothetical protein [Pirellulales bacterium]
MARIFKNDLLYVLAALAVCLAGTAKGQDKTPITTPETAPAVTSSLPTLESLLAESGFAYRKIEDGSYRITVELSGTVSVVIAREVTMGWKDSAGNDVKLVYLYRWLGDLPQGEHRPEELLAAINQLNDVRYIGRVVVNDYGVYLCNTFFLRRADAESLTDEVYLTANDALGALEQIGGLMKKLQG